jgi:hypothetical protein
MVNEMLVIRRIAEEHRGGYCWEKVCRDENVHSLLYQSGKALIEVVSRKIVWGRA